MDAVVLVGGFGTRLQSVLSDLPKPMAPMGETYANKPFLALLLEYLSKQGVTRIVLATHYMHQTIQSYFGSNYAGIPIIYALEKGPLYSGGAIVNAIHTAQLDKPFLVINGDTFVQEDYRSLYKKHVAGNSQLTMLLRHIMDTERSGMVEVSGSNITKFGERGEKGQSGLINAGVWVMAPELLATYPVGQAFSFEKDFLQAQIPHTVKAQAVITDGYFIDIGVPEDYARAKTELVAYI